MLDTNICSFIMREQSEVVLKRLEPAVLRDQRIVVSVKLVLRLAGTPIDIAIAGHAIVAGAVLVTNNALEFERISTLVPEDWVN